MLVSCGCRFSLVKALRLRLYLKLGFINKFDILHGGVKCV